VVLESAVVSWELSTSLSVEVFVLFPSVVEIDLGIEVSVVPSKESINPRLLPGLLPVSVVSEFSVVLLENLIADLLVVFSGVLNHSWERLEVWSVVPVVLHLVVGCEEVGAKSSNNCESSNKVSPEIFLSCMSWLHIWPVVDQSLVMDYWNSTLVVLSSSSDEDGSWPEENGEHEPVTIKSSSPLISELPIVFPGPSFWSRGILSKSHSDPWVLSQIILEPIQRAK